jgi:catechol 2,3-dioxygenase-like lactoylglutathione lyase family enzyme
MNAFVTVGEINIICTDLERSIKFYRDVLGFEVREQEPLACHMRCGQTDFLLLAIAQSKPPNLPYGQTPGFSIDLMVDDLAAVVAHFKAQQVEFVSEWAANEKRVFIRDPDGLVFEVIQH